MGTLAFSLPPEVRSRSPRLALYLSAYNLGRLASYAAAGALIGTAGDALFRTLSPRWGYLALQGTAALLMVAAGLYIAGWFPRLALLERLGEPLWRRLEPIGRRLIPVRSPYQALGYGMVWGWLPCGLVYTALLITVASGGAIEGASFMFSFGLGTLPAMTGIGMLTDRIRRLARRPATRRLTGALLILLGSGGLLFAEQLHLAAPMQTQQEADCRQ